MLSTLLESKVECEYYGTDSCLGKKLNDPEEIWVMVSWRGNYLVRMEAVLGTAWVTWYFVGLIGLDG